MRKLTETVVHWCSIKKLFRKISYSFGKLRKFGKRLVRLRAWACNFTKTKAPLQVFSCTILLKNAFLLQNTSVGCFWEEFYKKVALKNFAKFTGKHHYMIFFFNEVAGLRRLVLKFSE